MGTDSLEAMRQGSIDGEQKAYEIVVAAAKQWEQQAAATQTINRALEYLRTPEIEHTGNQWKDTDNWRADQKISNRVYQMTCSIWEDTKYNVCNRLLQTAIRVRRQYLPNRCTNVACQALPARSWSDSYNRKTQAPDGRLRLQGKTNRRISDCPCISFRLCIVLYSLFCFLSTYRACRSESATYQPAPHSVCQACHTSCYTSTN